MIAGIKNLNCGHFVVLSYVFGEEVLGLVL